MSIEGDTFKEPYVPSGLPRACATHPDAPDDRGFGEGIPEHTFATGPVRLDGDKLTTRYAEPTYGVGLDSGVGVDA